MAMAKAKLDTAKIAKSLSDHISKNIRIDFVAEGKRRFLGKEFEDSLREKAQDVAYIVAPVLDTGVKESYIEMLSDVADSLKQGFPPGTFKVFNRRYRNYKAKYFPGTERIFWKRSGQLASEFQKFATNQAAKLGFYKSKGATTRRTGSKYTSVQLVKQAPIRYGRRYRFTLNASLPSITASTYRDLLFRQQFLNFEQGLGLEANTSALEPSRVFRRIAYNEDRNMRPFIQHKVREHGWRMQQKIEKRLKQLL